MDQVSTLKNLYIAYCADLIKHPGRDIERWHAFSAWFPSHLSLIDRTGYIKMPFRMAVYDRCRMPSNIDNFSLTYQDCCDKRASEIIELSRQTGKSITVMYSGGIDSTAVLVSLMRNLSDSELFARVRVAMNHSSLVENPVFYYDFLRKKCNIISSESYGAFMDGTTILVTGECNDQLFGSDFITNIYRTRYKDFSDITKPYSREFITKMINQYTSDVHSNMCYDMIVEQIKNTAPCEIKTNFDFIWWYNFCYKWQDVYFRLLVRINNDIKSTVDQNFFDTHLHFFSTEYFQQWSMSNPHIKISTDNISSYKWEAKKYIYDYNRDRDYLENKNKIGSLEPLVNKKKIYYGFTDTFEFLDKIDSQQFYDPNNSFV